MVRSTLRSRVGLWGMVSALVVGLALLVMLTSPGSHPQPAQAQTTAAPKWVLSIDSSEIATFNKMKAVSPIEVPEYLGSGTAPRANPVSIVLERTAASGGQELSNWHQQARAGNMIAARKSASLTYYDSSGQRKLEFWLEGAWPAEYRVEQRGTRVVESVTLSADNFQRQAPQ